MPALVLTPKEPRSQFHHQQENHHHRHHQYQIMHDPKLSGFSAMPLPAIPMPHHNLEASPYRPDRATVEAAAAGLDKNHSIGLHGRHNHNHHHHMNGLHRHQHHPHQQHPYYGRSLSHPLANAPPPPHHHHHHPHYSGASSASRVPPLHAPFATEDLLLDISNRASANSFMSMLSALKAEGYGRNLMEYFRPCAVTGISGSAASHLDSNSNLETLYPSEGLHAALLSSSLPTQISTLYHRMISQSRLHENDSNNSNTNNNNRLSTELSRFSDARIIRPSSPSPTTNKPITSLPPPPPLCEAAIFPKDSKLLSPPHSRSSGISSSSITGGRLSLSMSPLRLSETSTTSSLSPSSPSLSLSPSSSSLHSNPHHSPDDTNNNMASSPPSSSLPSSSSISGGAALERKTIHSFSSPSSSSRHDISSSRTATDSIAIATERPFLPIVPTSMLPSPSWRMALSTKDVFNNSGVMAVSAAPLLSNVPHILNPDNHANNPAVLSRLKDYSSGWAYFQHAHHLNDHLHNHHPHHRHANPVVHRDTNAKEALLRPSTPEDYTHHRSSPGKELPTKLSKQARLRDRQDVTSALETDRERSERLSAIKKSASTQTQFSSFPHDSLVVPPPPPYFTTHDTILRDGTTTATTNHHHHPLHHHQQHHRYSSYSNNSNHPPPPPPLLLPPPPPFSQSVSASSESPSPLSSSSTPSSSLPSLSSSSSLSSQTYPLTSTSRVSLYPSITSNNQSSSLRNSSSPPTSISINSASTLTPPTKPSPLSHHDASTATIPIHAPPPPPPPLSSLSCPLVNKNNSPHVKIYSAHNGTPPPPPPQYKDLALTRSSAVVGVASDVVQDTPLNLSISSEGTTVVSSSSTSSSSSSSSVSCSPVVRACNSPGGQKVITKHKKSWIQRNGNSHETDPEDDAIEEHFRRSLGQKYTESSSSSSPSTTTTVATSCPTPPKAKNYADASSMTSMTAATAISTSPPSYDTTMTAQAMETEGIHITGSVDDHFARALGDQMWTAIKARSEPPSPEADPGTVDAHFAKALGASMWRKLQQGDPEVSTTTPPDNHHRVSPPPPTDHSSSGSTTHNNSSSHYHHNSHHHHHQQQQQQQRGSSSSDTHYPRHHSPNHPSHSSPSSSASPIQPQMAI